MDRLTIGSEDCYIVSIGQVRDPTKTANGIPAITQQGVAQQPVNCTVKKKLWTMLVLSAHQNPRQNMRFLIFSSNAGGHLRVVGLNYMHQFNRYAVTIHYPPQ